MGYKTNKVKLNNRKDKLSILLKDINQLSIFKQIEIYDKLIRVIKNNTSYKVKKLSKQTTLDQEIYDRLFEDICSLGKPFKRHRKNTTIYKNSMYYIKLYYKKHRGQMLDIFVLAREYFNSKSFIHNIYKTHKGGIQLDQFFKYDQNLYTYMPYLHQFPKSWFLEFAKGREYIENKYVKQNKSYNDELTKLFIEIWQNSKSQKITVFDKKHAIIFVNKAIKFAQSNSLSTRTIFDIVKDQLTNNKNIENCKYLYSDFFLNDVIPKGLVKKGIFNSLREIQLLKGE